MLIGPDERISITVAEFDQLNAESWEANASLWIAGGGATPLRDAMFDDIEIVVAREVDAIGGTPDLVDLGCADGSFLARLQRSGIPARLYGIDQCPKLVARARTNCSDAQFMVADLSIEHSALVKDAAIVTCMLTLVEMAQPAIALRNAAAVLRPGGLLVATILDPTVEALRYIEQKRGQPGTVLYDVAGELVIGSKFEAQGHVSRAHYFRFLRPLDQYVQELMASGFALESLGSVQNLDFPFQLQPRAVSLCARKRAGVDSNG